MASLDYSTFANPAFDANDYANAILSGESYSPSKPKKTLGKNASVTSPVNENSKEDISVALAKLSFGIEDVSKQLKTVVNVHHEALLNQASNIQQLDASLQSVKAGLGDIGGSVDKLRQKVHTPYHSLTGHVIRLQRLQVASDVLRRTSRFVLLARRLEQQMAQINKASSVTPSNEENGKPNGKALPPVGSPNEEVSAFEPEGEKELAMTKAALSISEILSLLEASDEEEAEPPSNDNTDETLADEPRISLRSISAVTRHLPIIEAARQTVTLEMENMIVSGLQAMNQSLLASSLQTAYNLKILPAIVESLVVDLTDVVDKRIKEAFDMSRLSKDANIKEPATSSGLLYKSRVRTEPTNFTAPQWANALWSRLEALIEDLSQCCIKVYVLEKVLRQKTDPQSQVNFLDEVMKFMENRPSATFWTTLTRALDKQCREAAKGSSFLQQTLSTGYPRFLRLFHEFFAKISVHTDTVYSQAQQSPETVLVLRAVSNFEALYLSRCTTRINEAIGTAFAGGGRSPPSVQEGLAIARVISNELDSAKFDPLLVRSVAKSAVAAIETLLGRVKALVVEDRSAITLLGPTATIQQYLNAQLVTCLYHCWLRLSKLQDEYSDSVTNLLKPGIKSLQNGFARVAEPLVNAIRLEIASIITRLHRLDLGNGMEGNMGGPSTYMKELVDKLAFIRGEILSKYQVDEMGHKWAVDIVRYTLKTFVLHASTAKPLGEGGKLQLTTDMTELEFAINSFLADSHSSAGRKQPQTLDAVGNEYRTLRALRPLLFLDNESLADPDQTIGLPTLIVLHHILVRSPLPLPHKLHGWHESQYVRFVEEHTEEEVWSVIEQGLTHWRTTYEVDGGASEAELQSADEYIGLARKVLKLAREP